MSRHRSATPYLRAGEGLDADDLRDLEDYFAQLRNYYDIPEDQPVFPERRRSSSTSTPGDDRTRPTRRASGRNGDDHPWRNTL